MTKITVVAAVLFIIFGLFMRWGFSQNTQSVSRQDMLKMTHNNMVSMLQQPVFQTKEGKRMAAIQKKVYCSVFGALCTNNAQDQAKNFPNSMFGYLSKLMIIPYVNPPASGVAYVQQSIQDAGFVTKTYAAEGIGFTSLRPFLSVWKAFRNLSYLILVFVIVIIGFLIMFQYKIDAHTVISIENALPRIVVALLLITFSYAIVGFLIDLTYLIILLIFQIFETTGLSGFDAASLQNNYLTANLLSWSGSVNAGLKGLGIYMEALVNIFLLIPWQMQLLLSVILTYVTLFVSVRLAHGALPFLRDIFGDTTIGGEGGILFVNANAETSIGNILGAIFALGMGFLIGVEVIFLALVAVALIGLLFLYFRIIFLLIGAYIQIIINVMFAPIFLLGEAIPGQNSFANWIKTVFAHLMVFPMVIVLLLAIQVIQTVGFSDKSQGTFSMPLLYGFHTSVLAAIISGAFLFAIPELVKAMVSKIAGESPIKAGPGLLFGGAAALTGGAFGTLSQLESLNKLTSDKGLLTKAKGWFGGGGGDSGHPPASSGDGGKGKQGGADDHGKH